MAKTKKRYPNYQARAAIIKTTPTYVIDYEDEVVLAVNEAVEAIAHDVCAELWDDREWDESIYDEEFAYASVEARRVLLNKVQELTKKR